jgi:hypothetical protein
VHLILVYQSFCIFANIIVVVTSKCKSQKIVHDAQNKTKHTRGPGGGEAPLTAGDGGIRGTKCGNRC